MKRIHRAAPTALALLAAAALAAPAFGQTNAPAPAGPDTMIATPAQPGVERWTLDRCISTALKESGNAKAARAQTDQAKGASMAAWRGILPSISASATARRSQPDKQSGFFGTYADTSTGTPYLYNSYLKRWDTWGVGAALDMNIISVPAIEEKRRADLMSGSAQHGEAEARNLVVFDVKQQFFTLLKAIKLAQVSRETEKLARDEEARSEALFQVGTVAKGDVLKARARRASTQLDRIRAENQVELQRSGLKRVLGVPSETPLEIDETLGEQVPLPDSLNAIQRAQKARPALTRSREAERAARAGLFSARAVRLPKVIGSLSVDRTRSERTYQYDSRNPSAPTVSDTQAESYATEWTGLVALTLPIFDGLAIEGNIRSAKGQALEAEANRRQMELDIAVEVQTAWLVVREARQRIDVAREGLASAEEDYKFSKGRYDLGAGTYLDLLTAELGLSNAKQALIEAYADALIAEAKLEQAIGEKRY